MKAKLPSQLSIRTSYVSRRLARGRATDGAMKISKVEIPSTFALLSVNTLKKMVLLRQQN